MKSLPSLALAGLVFAALPALAADFDGSKPLMCATVSVVDCERGYACSNGLAEDFGAPAFLRLDFAQKLVITPRVRAPILVQEQSEKQVLLQGKDGTNGWTLALEKATGTMTASITDRTGVYVLFGNCTPL